MAMQFDPPNKTIKSQLVRTPGLEKLLHSFIIRQLVVERVRCLMDDVPFHDSHFAFIEKFLPIPAHYKEQDQIDRYVKSESIEILKAFKDYETTAVYQEDLKGLIPFRGHRWHLHSSTDSGVLITIEV